MARPQTTVLEVLASRMESDPDGPYLDFEGVQYTAREMDRESNRLAYALKEMGVVHGTEL